MDNNQEDMSQQIGFSDEFTYNDQPIKYEITKDNTVRMYVEDCALALGVTQSKVLKDQTISTTVRWERVYEDLVGIERIPNAGDLKSLSAETKKNIRDELKDMTITETQLYLWSFKVGSEQGKQFRNWLATIVLPNLRQHGIYAVSYTHLRAHETRHDLVCRLLLEKKKKTTYNKPIRHNYLHTNITKNKYLTNT